MRQKELATTAKAFLLDNPEVSKEELREHLKAMAEWLLTEATDDYWNGLDIAWLEDAKVNLRNIAATERLSAVQQAHIVESLKVLEAGQKRVDYGDATGLLDFVADNDTDSANNHTQGSTIGVLSSNLENQQGGSSSVFAYDDLVSMTLAEKVTTLATSSYRDLQSSFSTVRGYAPVDLMDRSAWLKARDELLANGKAAITVNKLFVKVRMAIDYALMNGHLHGRNPIEKMKLTKDAESKRRAMTDEEIQMVLKAAESAPEARRWAVLVSIITGARSAEVAQLTKENIVVVDGITCIDINDDEGKKVKNKHSIRLIPLIDGAYGFNLEAFLKFVNTREPKTAIFGMTAGTYTAYFGRSIKGSIDALKDTKNVCMHSLRHSLTGKLKAAGVPLADAQGVLGHSSQSITYDLYGKGHAIGRLSDALRLALSGTGQ
ncbi:tyrosine-type recombinase/integrase [Pectobacterium peruviense]|uniref:site-specific integrase n=1 Tax=Pectobacterium peruviense TaxID=2066479 RepID=UPI001CB8BD56|nr:site-specific integrase [Pectobacterium peruviense]